MDHGGGARGGLVQMRVLMGGLPSHKYALRMIPTFVARMSQTVLVPGSIFSCIPCCGIPHMSGALVAPGESHPRRRHRLHGGAALRVVEIATRYAFGSPALQEAPVIVSERSGSRLRPDAGSKLIRSDHDDATETERIIMA
jgi:hypothetical protein